MSGPAVVTAVVAVAVLLRGGFFTAGRSVFVALAAAAFVFAIARDERATLRALRSPPVVVLALLALLATASAAWTVGEPVDAVRYGLVTAALAALCVASAVLCRERPGVERLALGLALVAGAAAAAGLAGAALRMEPWGERIGGAWRPGGTFEYPPALGLLQVAALPALLVGMASRRPAVSAPAALGAALAAAVLALSTSRVQIGLAGLVLLAAVVWSRELLGVARGRALAGVGLLACAGLVAVLVAGGYAAPRATAGDEGRLVGLGMTVVAVAAIGGRAGGGRRPVGASQGARERRPHGRRVAVAIAVGATIAVAVATSVSAPVEGSGGFTHGRLALWADAVDAALERPLLGSGADSFLAASEPFQGRPAIRFAHDLPLELGVELGLAGALLALALYVSCAAAIARAGDLRTLWLLGPAVVAFLATSLVDWQWHLAGSAAVFAVSLGPLIASRRGS